MFDDQSSWRACRAVAGPCLFTILLTTLALPFGTYIQYVASLCLIAAIVGVAMVLIVGFARVIMLTSGAMMAVGAYSSTILVERLDVPYLLSLIAAAAFGALTGAVVAVPASRFRGHYLAMATLVFQFVIIIGLREWSSFTGGAAGLSVQNAQLFGHRLTNDGEYLLFIGLAAAVAVAILTTLLYGHYGKALRAISATEIGAESFGIHVARHHLFAFVISSAAMGFAGALLAPRVRILDPESFGFGNSVFMLAYPVVGGMHSVWGGLLGGAILRALPEALRAGQELQGLIYAILVLSVMTLFPRGLVGAIGDLAKRTRTSREDRAPAAAKLAATPAGGSVGQSIERPLALEIDDVNVSFGALRAVDHLSLDVRAGTIHGLIGPNGAGKTTLFNAISGFLPYGGDIVRDGEKLRGISPAKIARSGIVQCPESRELFGEMTVRENLDLGGQHLSEEVRGRQLAWLFELFPILKARQGQLAQTLSGGEQQMLAIGRALMMQPKILILDEPTLGLAPVILEQLSKALEKLRQTTPITVLLGEQNVTFALPHADRVYVLEHARIVWEGDPGRFAAEAGEGYL